MHQQRPLAFVAAPGHPYTPECALPCPSAARQVISASQGRVEPTQVLRTGRFSAAAQRAGPGWLRELEAFDARLRAQRGGGGEDGGACKTERGSVSSGAAPGGDAACGGASSFVYYAARPFHPGRLLADALSRQWDGVVRSKGAFWLATRNDVMGDWQSAGGAWAGEPRCVRA